MPALERLAPSQHTPRHRKPCTAKKNKNHQSFQQIQEKTHWLLVEDEVFFDSLATRSREDIELPKCKCVIELVSHHRPRNTQAEKGTDETVNAYAISRYHKGYIIFEKAATLAAGHARQQVGIPKSSRSIRHR